MLTYFNLAAKFPITFGVKDLHIAAAWPHHNVCVAIFSCAMFSGSSIASLKPSCVLRSARSLGDWVDGNAGDQGKARTA